ncbi:KamA family radical SAM protein [Bacteriovoracaceae bacterium]|nr:KamA family radical SAM protein [Bacteriovoracaceae bacterium]
MEDFLKDLKHSIRDPSSILNQINNQSIGFPEQLITTKNHSFPLLVPHSFFQRLDRDKAPLEVWNQYLIHEKEFKHDKGMIDPINDEGFLAAPQIIHRYHNRVLFLLNSNCPIHCRYCFRKNEFSQKKSLFGKNFSQSLDYLYEHTEIEELIFTGGDPLMVDNATIENYLNEFQKIPHLKYIRFHTRVPVITPSRINNDFINLISNNSNKFHKIIICLHVNHAWELKNSLVEETIKKLTQINNCELLSQSVLLKNVNNDPLVLAELFRTLSDLRINPYYLHHPDQVKGAMHFYLSEQIGNEIFQSVRQLVPGWMLPRYIKDNPKISSKEQLQY